MLKCAWIPAAALLFFVPPLPGQNKSAELAEFQGNWEVTELVEDGKVIPKEAISDWLPSGGKFEIVENAMIFTSNHDGKKHAKVFAIDPTRSPKGLELSTKEGKDGWGIFKFDDDRLVICMADPENDRPTEFSAKEGSKRLLMTIRRVKSTAKTDSTAPRQKPTGVAARVLTDDDVATMVKGTWRYNDNIGSLFITFTADGTFSTVRTMQEIRLFQKVFVQTPVSSGTWSVKSGDLIMHVTASTHRDRVNQQFPFAVRSISDKDLIFVDYLGRVGQATKVR
jgi:uncharacterized protein (TIGR03067 family)